MSQWQNPDAQLSQVMLMLSDLAPGCVCLDTACPTGDRVPHMATDGRNHPRPYGLLPQGWSGQESVKVLQDTEQVISKEQAK